MDGGSSERLASVHDDLEATGRGDSTVSLRGKRFAVTSNKSSEVVSEASSHPLG
jgi:hypothetical protein